MCKFKFAACSSSIKVFSPTHKASIITDILSITLVFAWIFIYCIHISFQFDMQTKFIEILRHCSVILFLIEIIMRFNIGFYDQGVDVLERIKIRNKYMKRPLLWDIVGLGVLIFNYSNDSSSYEV